MGARGANTFPSRNRLPYPFSLVVRPLFCFVVCWHSLPFQDKYVSGDSVNFRGSDTVPERSNIVDLKLIPQTVPERSAIKDLKLIPQTVPERSNIADLKLIPQTVPERSNIEDLKSIPQTVQE